MQVAIDLHIHSALSPCSDNDMTPNNIVNMACLKELEIIAVTDHNSVENCESVLKCSQNNGILAVPGMEIETSEEIHMVCLFPDIKAALKVQETVYSALPPLENREDIFGQQIILDENDNVKGCLKRLLLTATSLGIDDVFDLVMGVGGIVIPAHVDRESYSIISNLGIIPENLGINYLEISRGCNKYEYREKNPWAYNYKFIKSSDAHYLADILERESFINLEEKSVACLLETLRR